MKFSDAFPLHEKWLSKNKTLWLGCILETPFSAAAWAFYVWPLECTNDLPFSCECLEALQDGIENTHDA